MALIKCPQCNHSVLSVASRCPTCGRRFHRISDEFSAAERPRRRWLLLGAAGAAVALTGVAVQGMVPKGGAESLVVTASLASLPPPPVPKPVPADTRDPAPEVEVEAAEPLTAARWAATWANVRQGPGLQYAVQEILLPGERVEVAVPTRPWSEAYRAGRRIGYVARDLLDAHTDQ